VTTVSISPSPVVACQSSEFFVCLTVEYGRLERPKRDVMGEVVTLQNGSLSRVNRLMMKTLGLWTALSCYHALLKPDVSSG